MSTAFLQALTDAYLKFVNETHFQISERYSRS